MPSALAAWSSGIVIAFEHMGREIESGQGLISLRRTFLLKSRVAQELAVNVRAKVTRPWIKEKWS
jgi:hypothetical protein